MEYRRYYPKGSKKKYVISDEQFIEMVSKVGFEQALERDNACVEIITESKEESISLFLECCDKIIANPRWYLDNLDKVPTFTIRYSDFYEYLDKKGEKTKSL